MRKLTGSALLAVGAAFLCTGPARAQFGRGAAEWTTTGSDAQRSSWLRTDPKISPASMQKPGFRFLWKIKFNNDPKQLNALTPPTLLGSYIGYRGFRSLAFAGGSSDSVFAVDTDLGRTEWQKQFALAVQPQAGSWACPGGMTANLARPTGTAFPGAAAGGRGGRGGPAHSAVGPAGEGAVTISEGNAAAGRRPAMPPPPAAATPAGRGANGGRGAAGRGAMGGGGFGRQASFVYALSGDGMLHSMYVSNGDEPEPPIRFLPPGANAQGFIVVDGVAYVTTSQGCGGVADGVWALDLASKEVTSWKSNTGGVAGSVGAAMDPDGTLYVATEGGELASIEPKTLKLKEVYQSSPGFTSSPVLFQYKDKNLVAALAKDGSVHLLDAAAMRSAVYKTPANPAAGGLPPGALASWQETGGTRWLLVPANSAIMAWKVVDRNGAPALEQGWVSREMIAPLTPMIVNGVIFAVSSGEYRTTDTRITAAQRAQRSVPAVLYALDGATGKELWNSGKTMTSFVHGPGLSAGASQMYLGTYDGTFYAFGEWIEH